MQKQALAHQTAPAISPWRRYIAWQMDYALCMALVYAVFYGLLRVSPVTQSKVLGTALPYAGAGIQLLIEPLLLHAFGTTPGKALMGLRVRDEKGRRPTLEQARARTRQRFVRGLGGMVPVLQLICAWKNGYKPCSGHEMCSWDSENALLCQQQDRRRWRAWACAAGIAAAVAVDAALVCSTAQPPCHGPLTVAQFARNYNYLTRYYNGSDAAWLLDEQGAWQEQTPAGVVVVVVGESADSAPPAWHFETDENGCIVRARLEACFENSEKAVYTLGLQNRAMLGAMALAGAQCRDLGWSALRVAHAFEQHAGDVDMQLGGVAIAYRLQAQNMEQVNEGIWIATQNDNALRLTLQIEMGAEAF